MANNRWAGIRNFVTHYQETEPTSPAIGDVWYNPLTRERKVWDGARWIEPTPGVTAFPLPAAVYVSPGRGIIASAGGSVSLTVTVVNQDFNLDKPTDFLLEVEHTNPEDFSVVLSAYTVTLNPGESATVTLSVADRKGGVGLTGNPTYVTVRARAGSRPAAASNTVAVWSALAVPTTCVTHDPSVAIKGGRVVLDGAGRRATLDVEVTNLDVGGDCVARTIDLTVNVSDPTNVVASVSQATVTLDPGASTTVTLTVADAVGSFPGKDVVAEVSVGGSPPVKVICTRGAVWAPGADYGYLCGGYSTSAVTTVERFHFPTEAGVQRVGDLAQAPWDTPGGINSSTAGYVAGGTNPSTGDRLSEVQRFLFPFDEGTATVATNTPNQHSNTIVCNCSTHGFVAGGYPNANDTTVWLSTIERLEFATESAAVVGVLALDQRTAWACGLNATSYGFFTYGDSAVYKLYVDRILFPFDSGTAVNVGSSDAHRFCQAGANSTRCGYLCGGGGRTSVIERFEFPLDSGVLTVVGYLPAAVQGNGGFNSTVNGYACDGNWYDGTSTYQRSDINRLRFPFDDGVAVLAATATLARSGPLGATDGVDHVTQFAPTL